MRNIIFDLDGTLIDSRPGIFAGLAHAMTRLKLPAPDRNGLEWVIGPPLEEVMRGLLAPHGDNRVAQAVSYYRDYYGSVGLYNAQPYDGVHELLRDLRTRGRALFIGTSKLAPFAVALLDHFGLSGSFLGIHGADPDGSHRDKVGLFRHVLDVHRLKPSETVVVGDRRFDVQAAIACGMGVVAATYGYGSLEELQTAGAETFAESPAELSRIL